MELLAHVRLQDLRHQAIDGTSHGRELLQHGRAVGARFERTLERLGLATDAAHPGQGLFLVFGGMGHGAAQIVGGSIRPRRQARHLG